MSLDMASLRAEVEELREQVKHLKKAETEALRWAFYNPHEGEKVLGGDECDAYIARGAAKLEAVRLFWAQYGR